MVFSNSATRSELRSAFKRLPGGYDKEIISPIDVTKKHYDIIISRGNATDDIKSASNDIVTNIKKLLGLTACGNNGEAIIRDTITPLITPDTQVYQQLERLIFG